MVKQYFAAPASSAGVERVFSAAGKMHDEAPASDTVTQQMLIMGFWGSGGLPPGGGF